MGYTFSQTDSIGLLTLSNFRGADFTSAPENVASDRAASAINFMLADDGTIQKRFGSHTVYNFSSHEAFADITPVVNGIYKLASKNYSAFIFHVANQLFVDDEMIDAPVNNAKSCGFVHNESLYLLTGAEYLRLWFSDSGQVQLESVSENCYIPTTSIGRVGGSAPGGTTGEPANLLTGWRKNSFATDGVQDKFYLETPAKSKDGVKVELRNSAGVFETVPDTDYYFFNSGYVYFHEPPAATAVPGQDNLLVTYCTPTDGKAKICGCSAFCRYGVNDGNNTWFFTGNKNYKNMDWHTKNGDPSYFPESGYTICGGEEAAIVGYSHLADGTLAIHKEKRGAGPTIYYRTAQMSGDGDVYFPLKDGPCGQGAISAGGFANFANDAIFLSDTGVYALTTGARSLLGERFCEERSYFINRKLQKAADISKASLCVHKDRLYLSAAPYVFVADARAGLSYGSYEWLLWEDLDMRVMFADGEDFYFGTADGRVKKLKDEAYVDILGIQTPYSDDDNVIFCRWDTPLFTFGEKNRKKSLTSITLSLAPVEGSKITAGYIADGTLKTVFDLTVSAGDPLETLVARAREKRFYAMQFFVKEKSKCGFSMPDFLVKYKIKMEVSKNE